MAKALTEESAERLSTEIVAECNSYEQCAARLRNLLLQFREGKGWRVLKDQHGKAYSSWLAWAKDRTPLSKASIYRHLTVAREESAKQLPLKRKAVVNTAADAAEAPEGEPYQEVWNTARSLKDIVRELRQLRGQVQSLRYGPGGDYIPLAQVNQWLTSAIQELLVATPDRICDHCQGESPETCEDCRGLGWTPKSARAKVRQ